MFDSWVARPTTRTTFATTDRRLVAIVLAVALTLALSPLAPAPAEATTGTISGVAFQDLNRDGVQQPDEPVWEGHRIYLFNGSGSYLKNTTTDSLGRYTFTGLRNGSYEVRYAASAWWEVREQWVPTTTGSLWPRIQVSLESEAVADFGWRPLVRSTSVSKPISEHVGPEGLRVQNYNDAITAKEIYEAVVAGLVGEEAPYVTVRFGYSSTSTTTTSIGATDGVYDSYQAVSYVSYVSWLDTLDRTLAHEYGHAWSLYYAHLVHQDPDLDNYLEARELAEDDRVGSSYEWSPREMIAEDHRQLFGSTTASAGGHLNGDIPPAWEVEDLEDFLAGEFMSPDAEEAESEPEPEPGPDPEPDPSDEEDPVSVSTTTFVTPSDGEIVFGKVDVRVVVATANAASAAVVIHVGGLAVDARYHRGTGHHIAKLDTTLVADGAADLLASVTHLDGSVEVAAIVIIIDNGSESGDSEPGNGNGGGQGPKKK